MNKSLKVLYTLLIDNVIIAFDTNFSAFHGKIKKIEPLMRSPKWFHDNFKEGDLIELKLEEKTYFIQKLTP